MKNSYSLCITRYFVCFLALIAVDQACAQSPSRERPEERSREVRRREEQQQLLQQQLERRQRKERQQLRDDIRNEKRKKSFDIASYLRGQDKDKDGVIGAQEITNSRTVSFLNRSGVPVGKRDYKVDELIAKYNLRTQSQTEQQREEFARQSRNQLPTFGVDSKREGVLSFGVDDQDAQDARASTLTNFSESVSGLRSSDFSIDNIEKAEELLNNFDRDKNQFLDGDEISRITWGSTSPQDSDLNHDGRLSKLELAKRFETIQANRDQQIESLDRGSSRDSYSDRAEERRSAIRRRSRSKKSDKRSSDKRSSDKRQPASPRRPDLQARSDRDRGSQRTSTTSKPTQKIAASKSYEKYIDRSFQKFDANSDGKLDQDELAETKLLKKASDINEDGFISKREALDFVSGAGRKKTPPSSPSYRGPDRVKSLKKSTAPTVRRSSASKTSFRSKSQKPKTRSTTLGQLDKNGDGQIQMHEYTDNWTAEKLETFRTKDKNSNGILSANEWAQRD